MRILIHMGDPYTLETPCGKRIKACSDIFTQKGHQVTVSAPEFGPDIVGGRKCSGLFNGALGKEDNVEPLAEVAAAAKEARQV